MLESLKDWFSERSPITKGALLALAGIFLFVLFIRGAEAQRERVGQKDILSNTFCQDLESFAEVLSLPYDQRRDVFLKAIQEERCVLLPAPVVVHILKTHGSLPYMSGNGGVCRANFYSLEQSEQAIAEGMKPWYTFVEVCGPPGRGA